MDLNRFCVKFFARPDASVDDAVFIPIFHEWIRLKRLKEIMLDVADYRHVPNGPGIMLITHEVNYAMDRGEGQFGLQAQRKLGAGDTLKDRILDLVRATAAFGALLEADQRVGGQLALDGSSFLYMSNDRLQAPNTDEGFAALKPDLEAAAAELYPGQSVSVSRVANDPRDRLTARIQVQDSVAIAALA